MTTESMTAPDSVPLQHPMMCTAVKLHKKIIMLCQLGAQSPRQRIHVGFRLNRSADSGAPAASEGPGNYKSRISKHPNMFEGRQILKFFLPPVLRVPLQLDITVLLRPDRQPSLCPGH